jgi:hypothetical protein
MQKTVTAAELGERFRAVFEEVTEDYLPYVMKNSDDAVLRRFDEVRARIRERTASFSEQEIADDVAEARAELPG